MEPDPASRAEPQGVFYAIAAAAVALTVGWWRGLLPVGEWLDADLGEPWTAGQYALRTLLHIDALHLMFNLYWVRRWAPRLELRYGSVALIAAFLWFGVASNGITALLRENGVGLSGLIYAALAFLWFSERDLPEPERLVSWRDVQFFAGWFVLCVVLTSMGVWRIGNVAHGSGAALGVLAGIALRWPLPARIAVGVAVPALAVALPALI